MAYKQQYIPGNFRPVMIGETDTPEPLPTKYGEPIYGLSGKNDIRTLIGRVGMTPVITTNSRDQQSVTFVDDPVYQKSQQMLNFEKRIASGEVQSTGLYGPALDGGRERRAFVNRESAYTSYDPATNIVTFYDPDGNITQQGQRTSGNVFGGGFLGNTLNSLSSGLNKIASDPVLQRTVTATAFAVVAPYAAASLAPYLSGLGAYAGVTAQAITNITIAVAQGVPIEKATENALVNVAVSGATGAVQQQIGKVISSPGVTNAITSTVSSGLATAAKGGSQADVEKAMTAGLVSSAASTAYKDAVDSTSTIASRAIGGAAGGAVTGGTEGAVIGGLSSAAAALSSELAPTPAPAPTPAVEIGKTAGLSPEQISSQIDSIIEQAPGVQTAGALPLVEMTASAALQQAEPLIRLVSEAANDPNYKVLLPAIQQRLGQLGLTIADVASRLNPAVLAAQLATYSPNAGDPNEDAKMAEIYRVYADLKMPSAVAPLETVNIEPRPVAPLDITPDQTQAEIERLARQNELLTPPTPEIAPAPEIPSAPEPAPEEPVTVIRVDPGTGEALVIKPNGEIFTVTVNPSTKPGSTILVPSPAPAPSPVPAPAPAPSPAPVPSPSPEPVPSPSPSPSPEPVPSPSPSPSPSPAPKPAPEPVPIFRPAPEPVPVPEPVFLPSPVLEPVTDTPSGVEPVPLVPPPVSERDREILDLIGSTPVEDMPSEPAPAPVTETVIAPEAPIVSDEAGTPVEDEETLVDDRGSKTEPKKPVSESDQKAKPKPDIFTKTYLSPKTKTAATSSSLGDALGTTGLTSYRGAGEIEGAGTGKARKKVWNEESLKLKDALGV